MIDELLRRCTFPPVGTAVSCAVSGGPDSMALMLLAHAHGLIVTAIHVDHGLRAESGRDIEAIDPVAQSLGISVIVHSVHVEHGPNLEARARTGRYSVLPTGVMTGHTADDQAETVLINLMRGTGAQGLSAMLPGFSRPLLSLRRSETHALCADAGIATITDSTNIDPKFQRNRIRNELLPLMADISLRDPVPLLTRTADVMRDDNETLEGLSLQIDPTDAIALIAAPSGLARRALRRWLSDPYPPDLATLERIMAVARGETLACDIGHNREIRRSKQRLILQLLG